ncbi:MAG: hypothetical protein ACRCS8_03525 [Brevinema sp.]
MKSIKFLMLSFFLFPSVNFTQSTLVSNFVTGLEVSHSQSNIISLEWKSDLPSANFSIYYLNSKPLIKEQDLKVATFVNTTNMKGLQKGSLHTYTLDLMLTGKGTYYFAVVLDAQVTSTQNPRIIPSLNSAVQAITITELNPDRAEKVERQAYFLENGYTITSLGLEKEKDFFRLRWFVYPKDLNQYVFTIYRSRYPIVNYATPAGLPVYAKVTNRFYYEDFNVSMETPYYYAVVPEGNRQWQRGLNVLNEPGVLLKDSPDFEMRPTIEYVRTKEELPSLDNSEEKLSEEDIKRAVEQTLANLQVLPTVRQKISSTDTNEMPVQEPSYEPLDEDDLPAEEVSDENIATELASSEVSTPKLGLSQIEREVAQFLEQSKQELFLIRSRTLEKQLRAEQSFLSNESLNYKTFNNQIAEIAQKVSQLQGMEGRLIFSYKIPEKLLKEHLTEYYNYRDLIILDRFRLKSQIDAENYKLLSREIELQNQLTHLQNLEKKDLEVFLKNRTHHYQNKVNFYKNRYDAVRTQKVADNITRRFHTMESQDLNKNPNVSRNPSQNISIEEMNFRQINDFSWTNNILTELPPMISSEERVKKLRRHYKTVTMEKVPTPDQGPKETWVSDREVWKKNHREVWLEQNDVWRQQIAQIIGEDRFNALNSKWQKVSQQVALREAARAFNEGRYDEALYLHTHISNDRASILMLGRSFYELKAYQYAYSVFIVAYKMGLPESKRWLDLSAEKLLNRKIVQH